MGVQRRGLRAIIVVLALIASACGTASASSSSSTTTSPVPTTTAAPTTTTTTTVATTVSPTTTAAPNPNETLVARARASVRSLEAYDAPNGARITLPFLVPNPHQFGGPLTLMITEGEPDDEWVKVQLPIRPNGSEGWIPTEDYLITSTLVRAEVDLSATSVKVFDDGELIAESQAAIGTDDAPTPLGTFFIAAKRRNPPQEWYLGTWALVLSGYSETLETFAGGLPVIAIHGTTDPDGELGQATSNGCVRVPDDVIQFLAEHVPLGSPVIITA